jgi:wyosine [tRNA(Phe)-imidazoG37] synthetase (radical SAM superfamily)
VLLAAHQGKLRALPAYRHIPPELSQVQEVALSGEGEPTLAPQFAEALQVVIHTRAVAPQSFFKLVLMTNGSNLDAPAVKHALRQLTLRDEVWIKLDAGTQGQMNIINRTNLTLKKILANIHRLGCQRPLVIQSLFPCFQGQGLSAQELDQYVCRLLELKNAGAQIALVQVYSAQQPTAHPQCGHLPLPTLAFIAQRIQEATGLPAQVF